MIFNLFKRKPQMNNGEHVELPKRVTANYMKVINGFEIADMEMPPFEQGHWSKEDAYKSYLENMQSLIDEYEQTGRIRAIEYTSLDDIDKRAEEKKNIDIFNNSFLKPGNRIDVEKTIDGKYKVINGRHRMYIAQKYGLKLLVHVSQEVIKTDIQ